jgi:hypothetical protein
MLQIGQFADKKDLKTETICCDLAVIGGGLAGVCCAITAAREGIKVVLIQDRPVLGGNASSEVRLWALGATSHLGNNNRWSREGGVIDEIIVENLYRNPEGNPVIFDTVIIEKVIRENNITLLLNTAVFSVEKTDTRTIQLVRGFCSQNSTLYEVSAPLFCDASGDGIVGYLAGAGFRMGAETSEEFGEKFAPGAEYGSLMGHSIFFYSKDTGKPVRFIPPSYALDDITKIPRYRNFTKDNKGSQLWWLEYGGRLDTIHDSEKIKWELWKIVYGVWNYIKNSEQFPGSETMTLEWVGMIPGKRESRRFEGDYMLVQQDIVLQRRHYDAVSYGGWAIDLHPADGVYSNKSGCDQWHSKGVYQVPYRCLYSRDVQNLFLAGRIISASHVANGSTRVMMTCAHNAQAVGVAAALCVSEHLKPRDLGDETRVKTLQQRLLKTGQYIPGVRLEDAEDLAAQATISASSCFVLSELAADGPAISLENAKAMIVPLQAGPVPRFSFAVQAEKETALTVELRIASRQGNFTPDVILQSKTVNLKPMNNDFEQSGFQSVEIDFETSIDRSDYVFVCLMANPDVSVRCSKARVTGILSAGLQGNFRVNSGHLQKPDRDIGVETMEFWIPQRWPDGYNLAMKVHPSIKLFGVENIVNGMCRPVKGPNAWVAGPDDPNPMITMKWNDTKTMKRIELSFDPDWDHPMESVLMGHPYNIVPYCVREYRILDDKGALLYQGIDNHQARHTIIFDTPITSTELRLELKSPDQHIPASLFEIRCYD